MVSSHQHVTCFSDDEGIDSDEEDEDDEEEVSASGLNH